MKKITLFAFACAMLVAPAVNAQEVTYVEDPAQGYIFNNMKDNWFIQGEGGVGVMMSYKDANVKFGKRLAPKADLFIGKWFSPLLGFRIGGHFDQMIGATDTPNAIGYRTWDTEIMKDDAERGLHGQKFNRFGVTGDVLFNLTNWLCGYRPGRFYNATLYAGAAMSWNVYRENLGGGDFKYAAGKKDHHDRNLAVQAGLLNSFAVSKHLDILLDLRFDMVQDHMDGAGRKTWVEYPSVLLGLGYKFGKTEWNAPVVPVCPPVVDNSALINDLRNKLEGANAKIASLQKQLDDCLNRPGPDKPAPAAEAPLATIYYPINVSKIVGVQNDVVNAVANVMANENSNYKLTGWADNYTGNDQINVRLRKDRVAGVKKALVGKGIAADRLETTIDNGNLTNYGPKCASLDRAVTINRK